MHGCRFRIFILRLKIELEILFNWHYFVSLWMKMNSRKVMKNNFQGPVLRHPNTPVRKSRSRWYVGNGIWGNPMQQNSPLMLGIEWHDDPYDNVRLNYSIWCARGASQSTTVIASAEDTVPRFLPTGHMPRYHEANTTHLVSRGSNKLRGERNSQELVQR